MPLVITVYKVIRLIQCNSLHCRRTDIDSDFQHTREIIADSPFGQEGGQTVRSNRETMIINMDEAV